MTQLRVRAIGDENSPLMSHKLRRGNTGRKTIDKEQEGSRKAQSNEYREETRAMRRRSHWRTTRTKELEELQKGHYVEMLCTTARGRREWFRAVVVNKNRSRQSEEHDLYLVRWLEDNTSSVVDMRSRDVNILGECQVTPDARRTRTEDRNIAKELRDVDDIEKLERTIRTMRSNSAKKKKAAIVSEPEILHVAEPSSHPNVGPSQPAFSGAVNDPAQLPTIGHEDDDDEAILPIIKCVQPVKSHKSSIIDRVHESSTIDCVVETKLHIDKLNSVTCCTEVGVPQNSITAKLKEHDSFKYEFEPSGPVRKLDTSEWFDFEVSEDDSIIIERPVSDLEMEDVANICQFEEESYAARIIQSWYHLARLRRLRRKICLDTWKQWITNDLPVVRAVSELRKAERHVKIATQHLGDRRLPLSMLLSQTQVNDLCCYDSSYVAFSNEKSIPTDISEKLLAQRDSLFYALGTHMRPNHFQHMEARRLLEFGRLDDEDLAIAPKSAQEHTNEALQTPFLAANHKMIHGMANRREPTVNQVASSELYHSGLEPPVFEAIGVESSGPNRNRQESILSTMANLNRLYSSPKEVHPVVSSVGKTLCLHVPARVQDELAEDYAISTRNKSSHNHTLDLLKQQEASLLKKMKALREDPDVYAIQFFSDNVGFGKRIRFETITHYLHTHRLSELPPSVRKWLDGKEDKKSEWLPMSKSGITRPEDLLASAKSDEFQRLQV